MTELRVSILNWTGDRQNWGCQATSFGLEQDILDICKDKFDVRFHKVGLGSKNFADRIVQLIFRGFVESHLAGARTSPFHKSLFRVLTTWIHGKDVAKIKQSDVVFFMAEGTMTGEKFFRSARLLMFPHLVATQLGKPVLSINQTLYSSNKAFARQIKNVYSQFKLVAVREPASLTYAQSLGLNEAVLIPDSAFLSMSSERSLNEILEGEVTAEFICLTASGDYRIDQSKAHFIPVLEFAKEKGLQVCGLFWQEKPKEALISAHATVGGLPLLFPHAGVGYKDVNKILSQSVCLVGGRYHTAIQAATEAVPFVAVPSGTHKTTGLLKMLDVPFQERPFEDVEGIREDMESLVSNRDQLSHNLKQKTDEVLELRRSRLRLVREMIESIVAER